RDQYDSQADAQGTRRVTVRALHLIGTAENIYFKRHASAGFTCKLADLVNIGRGIEEDGAYSFLEPEFATGVSNGYRFTLRGCEGQPVSSFQIIAEPTSGNGNAYCTDASR